MRSATVFNYLVEATLIGSLLILAALVFRALFRKKTGSRVLLVLWVLVAMRLLIPLALPNPVMNWLRPTLSQDPAIRPMADQVRIRVSDAAQDIYWKTVGASPERTPLHSLLWRVVYATRTGRMSRIALYIYLGGACAAAAMVMLASARFVRRVRFRKRRELPLAYTDFYADLCARRGLKRLPRVWLVEGLPGSTSFDLIRPVIALPDQADPEDIPAMLEREVCHILRRDCLWGFISNLCCIVHWFNPLVWLAAYLARTDLCLATDEYALRALDEPTRAAYARALIHTPDTSRARPSVLMAATPMTLRDRQLTHRIRLILHPLAPRRSARILCLALCALMLAGMFATAEQSSTANLPALHSPSIRQEQLQLTTSESALAYAKAFLSLEGVDAAEHFVNPNLTKGEHGWTAEWYAPGAAMVSQIAFTEEGEILGYLNGSMIPGNLRPAARPILTHDGEGQQWCAFLSDFIKTHMPELWQSFEAMDVTDSGRLDGEMYITVTLMGAGRNPSWQAVLMVAPQGQIISLLPIVG